uniref:Uncharacterized protein n=1 Tax=Tetranychus urticae TaxID=32264 RepID=T1KTU4_TETUR
MLILMKNGLLSFVRLFIVVGSKIWILRS